MAEMTKDERPMTNESSPPAARPQAAWSLIIGHWSFRLVVARHRLDGGDHLVVGDLVGGPGEARVATVHEDRAVALRIAAQRLDQLLAFGVVERTEIHRGFSFQK